jgi:hypothetical protein
MAETTANFRSGIAGGCSWYRNTLFRQQDSTLIDERTLAAKRPERFIMSIRLRVQQESDSAWITGKPEIEVWPSLIASTRCHSSVFRSRFGCHTICALRKREPPFPRATGCPRPQNDQRHKRRPASKRRGFSPLFLYANWRKARTEVVAGARRLSAAKLAELEKLPVRVVKLSDAEAIQTQCVELS